MKKFLFSLAVVTILSVPFASQVSAAPHTAHATSHVASHHVTTNHVAHQNVVNHSTHVVNHSTHVVNHVAPAHYVQSHAIRFAHGYLYRGRDHRHWGTERWDVRYGCNIYWDPGVLAWFYWCQPDNCYYPVSYCPYRTYTWSTTVVVQQPVVPVMTTPCNTCDVPAPIPAPVFARPY